jgi:Kef-type K+ transport system membrane component KefB
MSANTNTTGIISWDKKFPIIIPFFLFALLIYSLGHAGYLGHFGQEYAHVMHIPTVHYLLMLFGLWFFFLRLGAEIEISNVIDAGPLVIAATFGGVILPMLLTTSLVYFIGGTATFAIALYASAGAMATDVPMALGSARSVQKQVAVVMLGALTILAVGDDLIGVIAMTGLFAENMIQFYALLAEAVILLLCWFLGKEGHISKKYFDSNTKELIKEEIVDFTVISPVFWWVIAILNTAFLGFVGIEPILGGCLPMIFAPTAVKHMVAEKTESLALWLLLAFALVAGSVDVMSPEAWGTFTLLALIGGFAGKIFGIGIGGYIGRRQADYEGEYGVKNFTNRSLIGMAVAGACNGTVAIIFVSVAESKGLIPLELGAQMKIGFLLTVPASYLLNKGLGIIWKDNPDSLMAH